MEDDRDVLKSVIEANSAAIEVLVLCLEQNGMLRRGQYPDALRDHMEINAEALSPMALALLADIRESLLH